MTVTQVVHVAGDGRLRDGSEAMSELREFLTKVDTATIETYAAQILSTENMPDWGGFVLQDLMNEKGRRLGYTVENGRYRGVRNEVGFDGVWVGSDGHSIVVEVKTAPTY